MQSRMLRNILLPALPVSEFSHGGVRHRHIKTNVEPHLGSAFVFHHGYFRLLPQYQPQSGLPAFRETFDVRRTLPGFAQQLCTHDYHLALGLITSPILADQVMHRIDERIGGACHKANLVYTRYVDDLTISGPYDLETSGFADLVQRILEEHGFVLNPDKHHFGRLAEGTPITKIRVNHGHPDVRSEYLADVERQLADAQQVGGRRAVRRPVLHQGTNLGTNPVCMLGEPWSATNARAEVSGHPLGQGKRRGETPWPRCRQKSLTKRTSITASPETVSVTEGGRWADADPQEKS